MTLLAIAILVTPFLQQDALQKPVSFDIRASRLAVLVPELASKAGMALEVTPLVANEVVAVSAKEVPLRTLLEKIAGVASAEWRKEGEVLKLYPSVPARNRESNEELTRRLEDVRKAIAEKVKMLTPPKSTGKESPEVRGLSNDAAITQLLRGIDPTPIARLNGGERVVYSTAPNAMQRPFGAGAGTIIQTMVNEHNAQVAKIPAGSMDAEMDKMPDFVKKMMERQTRKITGAHKALLVVSKPNLGILDMTSLELRIYDADGKVAFSTSSTLGLPFAGMDIPIPGQAPKTPLAQKQTPIAYAEDSKVLMENFQGMSFSGGSMKLPPKLMEKLRRPDLTDPLSYMATDELFALSKLKGKPIVANVPDEIMGSINMLVPGGKQTVESFEEDLKKGQDAILTETDGWLVVKPAKPTESRGNRTDRVALTTLIKAAVDKGVPTLDDVAAYALTSPSPMADGVGMLFAMVLVPGMFHQGMDGMTNWDALRFYGTLSPTQRQASTQGLRLPFNAMTPAQQSIWRKVAFGAGAAIRTGERKDDEMPFAFAMQAMMGGGNDYREEATELMPNGLPPAAVLSFGYTMQPMASPVSTGGAATMGFMGVLGPDELALFKLFKDDPNMSAVSAFMPSLDKLRIGERGVITMMLQLPQEAFIRETLYDNKLPQNAQVASMTDLPPAFQKLVAERLEALKKSPFGSLGALMGGMGRGPIKP
ncbi:MAG: hypothetical protein ACAH95_14145 [Fimbriimonas sp.]